MEKRAREVTKIKDRQIGEGIARSDHSRSKEGMTRPSGQDRQSAVESVGKQLQRRWRDILSSAEMETADRQLAEADTCRPVVLVPPLDGGPLRSTVGRSWWLTIPATEQRLGDEPAFAEWRETIDQEKINGTR